MKHKSSISFRMLPAFLALALGANMAQAASINVTLLDSYETSLFNASASEITAYSPVSGYFFVTSSATNKVDVLQLDGSNNVTKFGDITLPGGGPNSVAVYGNVVAVAVQAAVKTDNGTVEFYDATTLAHLNSLTVGALPDMLTFTPDGSRLLVANEAEPNDAYTVDPVGTVSIIDMADGVALLDSGDVATISFAVLLPGDLDSSTRVFGPGASIAQDFEPEYIAVDSDGVKAYVTLQENNAIAIIDIASAALLDVVGLGFKDHSLAGNFMDSSDRDPNGAPVANIISRPVLGMYQPDAIASYTVDGQTYLITANEGDTRGWAGFNEEARVSTLDLDDVIFPTEVALKNNNSLGRLTVTNTKGKLDEDADNAFEKLYVFGTRSFSIWNSSGAQVYDSGDDIEQTVLALDPTHFNTSHDNNNLEDRSDNKGPEPEAATVAKIGSKTYAFIGLERQSAILVYDVSIPTAPVFEQYLGNRNFAQVPAAGLGGDLGPEGILFVPASKSPNGNNLLVVSNEISGSTTFYNIDVAITGADSSASPYVVPSQSNVTLTSILTVGDSVNNKPDGITPYRMVGIPDGLGAFDNGDDTFTVLMNHELGNTQGVIREHGAIGSFVSKWVINKNDLSVVSGADLIQDVKLWDGDSYESSVVAINRLCSADLPELSAFYNANSGLGYNGRIFMNGEEAGAEGRGFGHLMDGSSYELPRLGNYSYENVVAHPDTGNTTVVVNLDDSANGQVYVYVGSKTNSGLPVDKAGLTNGNLYGVKITGLETETDLTTAGSVTAFTLYSLGDVSGLTGAQLETNSGSNVSKFQRPEDGHWDPVNPDDFYFLTTASFTGMSRLWRLRFTDAANPSLGGTATMLLEGTEGQKMMDNMTINNFGQILIQEDPGGQAHTAKIWNYDIATDALMEIAQHDPDRFIIGAPNYLGTQDEESSGIIDVSNILGTGWYLLDVQAHYSIAGELVQGGQLLAMHIDYADTDSDGVPDSADNCQFVSNADQLNTDAALDGGNACDSDDDNDGVLDINDAFPLDYSEAYDFDNDGTGNNADTDDDNDSIADIADPFPLDANRWLRSRHNADLDNDSDVLVRSASTGTWTSYAVQNGAITGNVALSIPIDSDTQYIAQLDANGDGDADVLTRSASTGAWTLYQVQSGSVTGSVALGLYASLDWHFVGAGDFDGDGTDDVLLRSTSSGLYNSFLINNYAVATVNTFNAWASAASVDQGIGDFDGDGSDDLLIRRTTENAYFVFRSVNGLVENYYCACNLWYNPDWTFQFVGDTNNDGIDDITVRGTGATGDGFWWAFRMNNFMSTQVTNLNLFKDKTRVALGAVGDYNGDGTMDVLTRVDGATTYVTPLNNGLITTNNWLQNFTTDQVLGK